MRPLREGRAVHAPNRGRPSLLEPGGVAFHEAAAVIRGPAPARAAFGERDGVEAFAVDDHVRMFGVGVDRDVPARPRFAVGLESGGVLGELSRPPPCSA